VPVSKVGVPEGMCQRVKRGAWVDPARKKGGRTKHALSRPRLTRGGKQPRKGRPDNGNGGQDASTKKTEAPPWGVEPQGGATKQIFRCGKLRGGSKRL